MKFKFEETNDAREDFRFGGVLHIMADFEYLRDWCNDDWFWCGVVVRRADDCVCCGNVESLWGMESNAGEYIREVARELAEQLESNK